MADPAITVVRDPDELAEHAADYLLEVLEAAIIARGQASVALAGGSTPRAMNARLAATPRRERVDWSKIAFYFGDERCVPPEHADSNYRMTRETLFEPLGIADTRIFRIHGEDDPQAAADAYDVCLRGLGTPPVFDAIALGMGPDGHTASLFPGTLATIDDSRSVVANFVPKFASYRITLTPHVLRSARQVMITAAGAEKAESLRAVLSGPRDAERYPAQLVALGNANSHWFADAAAAKLWSTSQK